MPGHPVATLAIVGLVAFGVLVFLPMPTLGLDYQNVSVSTTLGETCFIFCSYSVQSVNPSVIGPATFIDLPGWLGYSVAPPCISCQYKVTMSLSNGQSTSVSESKFVSNLINVAYTDTVTGSILYVPGGTYSVSVVLTLNGNNVAQGSGSITVP
jgi:hypothetical protein